MSEEPLISIIMPIYNAEKRLKISIDSVINQDYKNIELILVNDGSIDRSGEICDFYKGLDSRVVVINQKNSGVSVARNKGIEKAKGAYLAFIDSDDTIEPDAYLKVVKKLSEQNADLIIFGMSFDYYSEEVFLKNKDMFVDTDFIFLNEETKKYFFCLYEQNYFSSVWNKVIRTSIVKKRNIRFEKEMAILEDFKFVLEVLEHTQRVIALDDVYYHYYNDITTSSLVRRPNIDYMRNFKILDHKLREFALKIGLTTNEDYEKINGMILRYYLIGIERIFSSNADSQKKYDELKRYINDKSVKVAVDSAKCTGKRLQVIHWLMKKKFMKTLWILFKVNDTWKRGKKKLSEKNINLNYLN